MPVFSISNKDHRNHKKERDHEDIMLMVSICNKDHRNHRIERDREGIMPTF